MRCVISFMLALTAAAIAAAQPVLPPLKAYAPVAITLPAASTDASFAAFRAELAAVAKSRVYAALGLLVQSQGFFWDRDFARAFDPRKPALDNLAAAIQLEHRNGSGWQLLAELAAEAAVEPMASRPGVVCAPANPSYDGVAFARLLHATHTRVSEWAYPRAAETKVQATPQPAAAVIGTLGPQFVRLLGFEGAGGQPAPERKLWARVATPDASSGFVAPGNLMSLTAERLCYAYDLVGGWRIAGYVAAGE